MAGFRALCIPERSPRDWLLVAIVFSGAVVWHLPQLSFVQMNPDEGIVLAGADRILRGAVLYRDFFSFYTPGSYYWTALLFRVFGHCLLSARSALLVYCGLAAAITYLLARRVCRRGPAILASLAVIFIWSFRFLALHNWDSTMAALVAMYSMTWLLQRGKSVWALTVGAFAALTVLTEQSKGAGLLLGIGAGMLATSLIGCLELRRRDWVLLVVGFASPFVVNFAYFGAKHSITQMLKGWLWPVLHYSAANRLPYGASIFLNDAISDVRGGAGISYGLAILTVNLAGLLIAAIPLVIVLFAVVRLCTIRTETATDTDRFFVFFGMVAAGLIASAIATGRADLPHLIYLAPLFSFLVPALMDVNMARGRLRSLQPLVAAAAVACLVVFSLVAEWPAITARQRVNTRRGNIRMQSADEALLYIQLSLPQSAKLLVHPYNPLYSFLSATENPSRYEYLQPGMHTRGQFAEVTRELASRHAPVLLDLSFLSKLPSNWPSTPAASIAVDPVTDYVLANYRPCAILNPGSRSGSTFIYMTHHGTLCPAR